MQMRSLFLRYGLAIGLSSVVLLVTVFAPHLATESGYILALAAIVFTAWYGGRGPGWLATLVSALTIDYFLIHPIGTFWITSWEAAFVLTVFVVVAIKLVEFSETRGRDRSALQASEERWKAVFENTPTMYFMVDQSGIILSVNPFGAEQLGYRVEELVGTPVLDVFHEADREAVQRHVSTCLTHVGQPMMWEFRKVRKDGRIIWVRETAKTVRFGTSERVVLVACEDITERKRAEEAAQAAKVRFEGILEIAQDAIISVDSNRQIILFNQGAEKVFGYTQAEIIGRPLDLLLPQRVEEVRRKHIEDFAGSPDVPRTMGQPREVSGRRKDGGEFPAEASISKLDLGSTPVFTVILRDITERKRTDAMLAGEKRVLEMVAKGDSLSQILDSLCRLVEEQAPGILASILLVEHNLLRHGGAPSLPKAYIDAIEGVAIGPCVGSCGTAAYRGEQVIVSDIATDPLWADYRAAALSHSLQACWSTPIFSSEGKVNATFAMYYQEPRSPGPHEQEMIGQITHLAGVAIERARAVEKLRESEARYRILVEHAPEAIVVLDVDAGRFVDANQNAVRLFGLSREALMRVGPIDVSPSTQADGCSSSESILEKIRDAVDGGEPVFQWTHLNAAGEQLSCEVRLVRMPAAGHVLVRGSVTDITERKQAEQRLLAQHTVTQILAAAASLQEVTPRILRAICENLIWDMGALWTVDKEAGVLRCVEVWHEKSIEIPEFEAETRATTFKPGIGLPGAVWRGRKPIYLSDLSTKERATFPRAPIAAREGLHAAFAFPILLSGEVLGVIDFFSREIREPDQDLLDMMITVGSQIGQFIERKRAEDTVRKIQLELAHVVRVSTLGELTATIAHEINQPLGAIVNNAGASLRWLAAQNFDEVRQSIERVIKDGHRASEIISRIRALVKKSAPQKDTLHLNDTISEIMSLVGPELQTHEVAMHTHLSPDLPAVLGDRIQVQQVLLNLMMNAIEAMTITKEGPRELWVGAEKHDAQYVVVRVQDSGPGIAPQQQDRLFEAFYSTKPGGLGMGLAICRSIVEAHGGRLWTTANEDRGAAFHFTLPIKEERSA